MILWQGCNAHENAVMTVSISVIVIVTFFLWMLFWTYESIRLLINNSVLNLHVRIYYVSVVHDVNRDRIIIIRLSYSLVIFLVAHIG